jgi:hypothetical protein
MPAPSRMHTCALHQSTTRREEQYLAAGILQAHMVAEPIRYAGQYVSDCGVIACKRTWNNVSSHDHIADGA